MKTDLSANCAADGSEARGNFRQEYVPSHKSVDGIIIHVLEHVLNWTRRLNNSHASLTPGRDKSKYRVSPIDRHTAADGRITPYHAGVGRYVREIISLRTSARFHRVSGDNEMTLHDFVGGVAAPDSG